MDTRLERRVAFGFGNYEPLLRATEADGLMSICWGQVPYEHEVECRLGKALATSGIHDWLHTLFHENRNRLPPTSALTGPCYGSWIDCPADIGEIVVDILATFIQDAMRAIIASSE